MAGIVQPENTIDQGEKENPELQGEEQIWVTTPDILGILSH